MSVPAEPSFLASLAPSLDEPVRDEALLFTLSNLRARFLPELPPSPLPTRALILGMGTLGCQLARSLLAWGVTALTLVDHGQVRPANPTRQCLYTSADVGRGKVEAAAAALRALSPACRATPCALSIPTPGHGELDLDALGALEALIVAHDLVFLCTDSRQSRWAPSLLAALHGVPAISIGLTFDAFVVIRHAPGASCYFCADSAAAIPSAPAIARPPSELCTLTRPGLAVMAAAAAAELTAALLCHGQGLRAPAEDGARACGPLGPCFNVLRHCLPTHTSTLATLPADPACSACSPCVLAAGKAFLLQALAADGAEALQALLAQLQEGSGGSGGGSGGSQSGRGGAGGLPPALAAAARSALPGGGSGGGGGSGAAASASGEGACGTGWVHF
jgi:ubiquitin-like modifier-activating enzyme ATG7